MTQDPGNFFTGKILPSVFWVVISKQGSFLVNLASQLAIIRILAPEDFGQFALSVAAVDIILLFISAWSFSMALIQIKGVRHLEATVLFLSLVAFCLITVISGLSYIVVVRLYGTETAVLFCGLALVKGLSLLSGVYGAILQREFNFKSWSLVQAAASIISVCAALGAAVAGLGLWRLFIREVVFQGVVYVGFRTFSNWSYGLKFDRDAAKKIFSFCWKMFISRCLEVVLYRIDKIMVGLAFGSKGLGFYERSQYFCTLATSSMTSLSIAIGFPVFANVQTDVDRLKKGLSFTNFFFTRISFMFLISLFIFPEEVAGLLFGEKWISTAPVLRWLALYIFLKPLFENLKIAFYARGQTAYVIKARVLQIVSFIPLFYFLTSRYGLEGAASAFVILTAIGLVMLLKAAREEGFLPQLHILRPVLASLITVVVLTHFDGVLQGTPSLFKLLIAPALFGMVLIPLEVNDLRKHIGLLLSR